MSVENDLPDISSRYQDLKKRIANQSKKLTEQYIPKILKVSRPISDEEINKILSVVPRPVCILHEMRNEMYDGQISMIRVALSSKILPADEEKAERVVNFYRAKLLMHLLKGAMTPGSPLGMMISDDLGASVMQGTLNTRHKPGSKQNASGGLRAQREVLGLRQRSSPALTLCFTKRESFESIMTKWRSILVEVKVDNLIYNIENDIRLVRRTIGAESPHWYALYADIFGSSPVEERTTYVLELRIRTDTLYNHSLTLADVTDAINRESGGEYTAIHSPLNLEGGPVIHIVPEISTAGEGLTSEVDPFLLVIGSHFRAIREIHISGLPGVTDILPIANKLIDFIESEVTVDQWNVLILDPKVQKMYGMKKKHVIQLCNISGISVLDKHEIADKPELAPYRGKLAVVCRKPVFDLQKLIYDAQKPDSNLPAAKIKKVDENEWRITIKPVGDAIERYERLLRGLKLEFNTLTSKGTITVTTPESYGSALNVIAMRKLQDQQQEMEYEKEQRQRRIEEGVESQISILRPPALSAVAAANKYYIAELVGGKLSDLIDIPGIDLDRSYSNYAIEIGNLLGVEAARRFLTREIIQTWENSASKLQPITVQGAVHYMTSSGSLRSFSTQGISSQNIGFMTKSTVSFAMKHIQTAAINNEIDPLTSPPAGIMLGKLIRMGTGLVNVSSTVSYTLPEIKEENVFAPDEAEPDIFEEQPFDETGDPDEAVGEAREEF